MVNPWLECDNIGRRMGSKSMVNPLMMGSFHGKSLRFFHACLSMGIPLFRGVQRCPNIYKLINGVKPQNKPQQIY